MDVIAATAFGIDAEAQMNPDGPFMTHGVNLNKSFIDAGGVKAMVWTLINCKSGCSFTMLQSSFFYITH